MDDIIGSRDTAVVALQQPRLRQRLNILMDVRQKILYQPLHTDKGVRLLPPLNMTMIPLAAFIVIAHAPTTNAMTPIYTARRGARRLGLPRVPASPWLSSDTASKAVVKDVAQSIVYRLASPEHA
jgi:hypothetical protein